MTHPEMARMLVAERQRELLARAEDQRKLRFARRQRKAQAELAAVVPHVRKEAAPVPAVPAARRAA